MSSWLRQVRQEKGLTLDDVAGSISVSTAFLSQVERGLRSPSRPVLADLASVYEVPIETIRVAVGKFPDWIDEAARENPSALIKAAKDNFQEYKPQDE